MIFRFTLTHAVLGSVIIDEPDGWKTASFLLERNEEHKFASLWEKFEGNFTFYGDIGNAYGGMDFIRQAVDTYGPDTVLEILVEASDDQINFETAFDGILALEAMQENDNNTATIPIIPNDFKTTFKNRYETPVDLQSEKALDDSDADVFPPINMEFTSQTVPMAFEGESSPMGRDIVTQDYLQMSWNNVEVEEFDEYFMLPQLSNPEVPGEVFVNEYAGEYRFIIQTNMWFSDGPSTNPQDYWIPVINVNGVETWFTYKSQPYTDEDATYTNSDYAEWELDYTVFLEAQSLVRIYFRLITLTGGSTPNPDQTLRWNGNFVDNGVVFPTRYFFRATARVVGQTIYPNTQSNGFLIHDAGGYALDRATGKRQSFHSEILGSAFTNYKQYDSDGCRWRNAIFKGLQIRQYTLEEKPFFLSFQQWWEGINPILCLGLGYEEIDGEEVIRVEGREHFFDPVPVLNISNVAEIRRSFDIAHIPKTVKIGYKVWQSQNISGIDDAQTKHTYAGPPQRTGTEITLESEFIAASQAIETTRRQTRKKSADYKFDDNTFIVSLGDAEASPDNTYLPELDENFSEIENLQNPETRYNTVLTPARNFMRWAKVLFGGLQHHVGQFFKFTAGEGNYDVVTNYDLSNGCNEFSGELSEKQNIQITDDYIHRAELYEIKTNLDYADYVTIRNNRKKAIGISQSDVEHRPFFIKSLRFPVDGSEVTILAWPVELFNIETLGSSNAVRSCEPVVVDDCANAYLTEDSDEFVTEDNECLILQ